MSSEQRERDGVPEGLPEGLRAELKSIYHEDLEIPPGIERRILGMARARVRVARRRGPWLAPAWIAAAAAVLLVATGLWFLREDRAPATEVRREQAARLESEDVDGNGRVDILDAMRLARLLEAGEELEPRWDLTGDGRIDRRDVDRVAQRAVAL